jgi:hypothetical protein
MISSAGVGVGVGVGTELCEGGSFIVYGCEIE